MGRKQHDKKLISGVICGFVLGAVLFFSIPQPQNDGIKDSERIKKLTEKLDLLSAQKENVHYRFDLLNSLLSSERKRDISTDQSEDIRQLLMTIEQQDDKLSSQNTEILDLRHTIEKNRRKYAGDGNVLECTCSAGEKPLPVFDCPDTRVGIASLTRHTDIPDMEFWLDYHFAMGICHIWLRIQHTPWLHYLLALPKYNGRVTATYIDDDNVVSADTKALQQNKKSRIYMDLIAWQNQFINKAIQDATERDLHYMFHIDDDEMVYVFDNKTIPDIFDSVPANAVDIHFENFESILNVEGTGTVHAHNRFAPQTVRRGGRLSYANGKSAGKVSDQLTTYGPHNMRLRTGMTDEHKFKVPKTLAVVLHYESSTLTSWFKKFSTYQHDDQSIIPFGFYKESIDVINQARDYFVSKKKVRDSELRDKDNILMQVDFDELVAQFNREMSQYGGGKHYNGSVHVHG